MLRIEEICHADLFRDNDEEEEKEEKDGKRRREERDRSEEMRSRRGVPRWMKGWDGQSPTIGFRAL